MSPRVVVLTALSLLVLSCGGDDLPTQPTAPTPVATTVTLTPSTVSFASVGASEQLTAIVKDQNGATMSGAAVAWTSLDVAIATVSSTGLVTSVGNGAATITASSGSASGSASITVELQPASILVVSGDDVVAPAGSEVPELVRIRALAEEGDVVPGVNVQWEVVGGGGTLANAQTTTDANGEATAAWTLGDEPALNEVEVNVEPLEPVLVSAKSWSVSARHAALTSMGDSSAISVRLGADIDRAELRILNQAPWVQDLPIVDSLSLQRGVLLATGPGRATLSVSGFGVDMGTLGVEVKPATPLAITAVQRDFPEDGTVALLGYRINELPAGTVRIDGQAPQVISVDSAEMLLDPGPIQTDECVAYERVSLEVSDAAYRGPDTVRRPAPVESLAVGETRTIEQSDFCLRLFAGGESSRYALAMVDRVWVDHARTAFEPRYDTTTYAAHNYSVTVRGEDGATSEHRPQPRVTSSIQRSNTIPYQVFNRFGGGDLLVPRHPSSGISFAPRAQLAETFSSRTTPWEIGDTYIYHATGLGELVEWRVMRLYEPNLVVAIATEDMDMIWQEPVISLLDKVMTYLGSDDALDIYRSTTGPVLPGTEAATDQFVFMFGRLPVYGQATCDVVWLDANALGVAWHLNEVQEFDADIPLYFLGHELAHSWDCENSQGHQVWASEGFANFMGWEQVRQYFDMPPENDVWNDLAFKAGAPMNGAFNDGYGESSSFLRNLIYELSSEHGVSWEDARKTVGLGRGEGWWGLSQYGPSPEPGLTARMRGVGEPTWDPVDARLDWVLSVAVDDRAEGPAARFHDASVPEAWRDPEEKRPGVTISWFGDDRFYRGTVDSDNSSVSGRGLAGSNGYVLLEGPGALPLAVTGTTDTSTMVWRILRFD